MFFVALQVPAATWGLLMCVAIASYGVQSWTTLFIVIIASASISGTPIVMVPWLSALRVHALLLAGPAAVVCFWTGGKQAISVGVLAVLFIAFILRHGNSLHREYWQALERSAALENATGRVVESRQERISC